MLNLNIRGQNFHRFKQLLNNFHGVNKWSQTKQIAWENNRSNTKQLSWCEFKSIPNISNLFGYCSKRSHRQNPYDSQTNRL